MSTRLFGTDGIRAPFGTYPLDRQTVVRLGFELGRGIERSSDDLQVIIGGDTRESTPTLCAWLATGLTASRVSYSYGGILPTPAVAYLTRFYGAHLGIAVSASHNPHPDNGIKLIDANGFKWRPEAEAALERRLSSAGTTPAGAGNGPPPADSALGRHYLQGLAQTVQGNRPLQGLRLALDTANGAASPYAAELFRSLGARASVIHDRPDGRNVNLRCGSTAPQEVARLTATGYGLGLAFDGDADRVILVDEEGTVRDGDAILYLWALDLRERGELEPPRIVATVMSNLGLERALADRGIEIVRCDVGDRVVVDTMRREGIVLGGEQSGHVVHLGLSTTGDGLLTAVQIANLLARRQRPLSELLRHFRRYPQVLRNVGVHSKPELATVPAVAAEIEATRRQLGGDGRLLLRYSGTEPLARIMIEGPDEALIDRLATRLAETVARELGRPEAASR